MIDPKHDAQLTAELTVAASRMLCAHMAVEIDTSIVVGDRRGDFHWDRQERTLMGSYQEESGRWTSIAGAPGLAFIRRGLPREDIADAYSRVLFSLWHLSAAALTPSGRTCDDPARLVDWLNSDLEFDDDCDDDCDDE